MGYHYWYIINDTHMRHILYVGILFALLGISGIPNPTYAQIPCGSIIAPEYWADSKSTLIATPIADCADPFLVTKDMTSPYRLSINGNPVSEGGVVEFDETGLHSYSIFGFPTLTSVNHLLFLHDGNDYRFVDMNPSEPQESDYQTLAEAFFPQGTDVSPYVRASIDGDYYFNLDPDMQNMFWEFSDYVDQHFVPKIPQLAPGTYTLVSKEYLLVVTQESFLQKLFAYVFPTAHAQSFPEYVYTLTFTITQLQQEGISNILFLPGIQASRLYTQMNGEEERLWEPFGDGEVEMLRMTDTGESMNDVYTKDVVDELPDGSNIYKEFIQHLIDLDDSKGGPKVTTYPYDWRYDVFDIVENGTKIESGRRVRSTNIIEDLAFASPTKKVTLIAHSNGGILAKAIMLKLEEEGKAGLVDKVIFIATPHIGTPKGLAALLHGYDQEHLGGLISSDEKIRSVMKNMSGVYGLLPSEAYVSSLTEPMISFDGSETTKLYRDAYGFTLTTMDEYTRFLKGVEGRVDAGNNIIEPSTANFSMLATSLQLHKEKLDSWGAPEGVEVYNIVGTGMPTPKSIEYREFKMSLCDGCPVIFKLEPVLHLTRYGDKTVVSKSAKYITGDTKYIDLKAIEEDILFGKYDHSDITESEATQVVVDHILHGSSTEGINFVSTSEPSSRDDGLDIYTIHSPAHIYLKDSSGNITGKTDTGGEWRSEIAGSDYFEAGGVKYVLVPSVGAYTIIIEGEGSGVYTHSLTTLKNEVEAVHHTYTASVTPTSVIEYIKTNNTYSNISVDEDGDGETDMEMTLSGDIIEEGVTYDDLRDAIHSLGLARKYEYPLLTLVTQAEKLSNYHHKKKYKKRHAEDTLLHVIEKQLEQYKKKGLITKAQYREIDKIIDKLIEK